MKIIAYTIGVLCTIAAALLAWVSDVPWPLIIVAAVLYGGGWACMVWELDTQEGR